MAELRVGIDVSPLELTGAGTAPYLRNLLDQLAGRPPTTSTCSPWGRWSRGKISTAWPRRPEPRREEAAGLDRVEGFT
jgi:hypothetical protein